MVNQFIKFALLLLSMSLAACSSIQSLTPYPFSQPPKKITAAQLANQSGGTFVTNTGTNVPVATVPESSQPLGGDLSRSMDTVDKSKLMRSLDSPIGKATTWTNGLTGINYTVVPTQKVTINGNSLCRRYLLTFAKADKSKQVNGVACISTDGNWHSIEAN